MATLSAIEIDIGRWLVSCLRIFQTHLIFLFCSTIMPSPPRLEGFHCSVRFTFHIYGKIWLLSPLNIFSFSLLKCFESLTNDRDSLFVFFVFIAFASFSFSKFLLLSFHPTGKDPNHFWETHKQLATFFPLPFSTGLNVAVGS